MGQMILIDSNIYIGLLRQGIDPVQHLDKHYPIGDLASCGIVEAEVIRGIRFTKRRQHIAEFFSLLQRIPTPSALWDEVSDLAWTLDRKGIVLPLSDIIIAACALRANAAVLTVDKHFQQVPELVVISP